MAGKKKKKEENNAEIFCAYKEIVKLDEISVYPHNANMHPRSQILLLAKLIDKHGWRSPITISNQSGYVVRGHGRLEAARILDLDKAPVDYQDYESEEMERADRVADNRINELSEWDKTLLRAELEDLDSGILDDMDLTGFDSDSLAEFMTWAPPDFSPEDSDKDDQPDLGDSKNHVCPSCGYEWKT